MKRNRDDFCTFSINRLHSPSCASVESKALVTSAQRLQTANLQMRWSKQWKPQVRVGRGRALGWCDGLDVGSCHRRFASLHLRIEIRKRAHTNAQGTKARRGAQLEEDAAISCRAADKIRGASQMIGRCPPAHRQATPSSCQGKDSDLKTKILGYRTAPHFNSPRCMGFFPLGRMEAAPQIASGKLGWLAASIQARDAPVSSSGKGGSWATRCVGFLVLMYRDSGVEQDDLSSTPATRSRDSTILTQVRSIFLHTSAWV